MRVTIDTNIDEITALPECAPVQNYLVGSRDGSLPVLTSGKTPAVIHSEAPTWEAEGIARGLNRLVEVADDRTYAYQVYPQEEIEADPSLKDAKVFFFPGDPQKPTVIVCAGGAYVSVCSIAEGFPTAADFNTLGYNALVLNYRTHSPEEDVLFPKPVDDLAQAVKFFLSHHDMLGIQSERYAVCGFSAGGNLVNMFGMDTVGYAKYGLPAPELIFSIYTAVNLDSFLIYDEGKVFLETMLGKGYDEETMHRYNTIEHINKQYPPCCIVACDDDDTVPPGNSRLLAAKLKEQDIPVHLEMGEHGGHGFGVGDDTSVKGWIERGVQFWELITES